MSQPYLQGLVCVGHWQDFVPGVDAAQFAERAEQPLTGPTVELEFLLVMLRTGQNLRKKSHETDLSESCCLYEVTEKRKEATTRSRKKNKQCVAQ